VPNPLSSSGKKEKKKKEDEAINPLTFERGSWGEEEDQSKIYPPFLMVRKGGSKSQLVKIPVSKGSEKKKGINR